jgi:murein DD-endopeptidase MepM/ murein hydrolase activator NlpD
MPPAVPTIPADPHGELSALTAAQTVAAEAELASLTDSERALLRQLQGAREVLAARRFALVALARDVATAQGQLDAARATERQARARVDETTAQLERLRQEIVDLAAAAYRNHVDSWTLGAVGSVDVANASTLTRATAYARSDAAYLNDRVDVLAALQRRLEGERRTAEAARAAAETSAADLEARLAVQRAAYDDAATATEKAKAAAMRGLRSDVRLVALMMDPQFGGDNVSSVLAFVQSSQPDPTTLDGIFSLPIPTASLVSPFGMRIDPIAGSVAFHAGLDFAADAGKPITAAGPGMVVVAGDCGGYGNCVVIDHGTSLATLYGHQSQLLVRVGDTVAEGDVIGLVGSTGISTGPHLHLEVRLRGAPVDPVPTLRG